MFLYINDTPVTDRVKNLRASVKKEKNIFLFKKNRQKHHYYIVYICIPYTTLIPFSGYIIKSKNKKKVKIKNKASRLG